MQQAERWAPGEAEARRIIESMADEMLQGMDEAGYTIVLVEPGASGSPTSNTEPEAGRAH